MNLLIAAAVTFFIVALAEVLWRLRKIQDETARKFVHIAVGTFVAFWPYFMTWREIQLMCLAFVIVIAVSWKANVFRAVHNVKRRTWGELLFPVGIGMSALIEPSALVFTAAILHLSLADGFAAVVGIRYGLARRKYTIRSYPKSVLGTLTFWLISTVIIVGTVMASSTGLSWPLVPLLVWLPLAATLVENVAVAGTDNIFVPLLIIVVLQTAHIG